MPKTFRSVVDASFFKYLSRVWDSLPQQDRNMLVEYWRGLIRATSDEYINYLETEAAAGLLTITPYEVRKWRAIKINNLPELNATDESNWVKNIPAGAKNPYHFDEGTLRIEHLHARGQSLEWGYDRPVTDLRSYQFSGRIRLGNSTADTLLLGFYDGVQSRGYAGGVMLSLGRLDDDSALFRSGGLRTVDEYTIPETTGLPVSSVSVRAEVLSQSEVFVQVTGLRNLLVDILDRNYIIYVSGSASGNNVSKRVLGVRETTLGSTLVVDTASGGFATPEADLDFALYLATAGGILVEAGIDSNSVIDALPAQALQGFSTIGGQSGLRVSAGTYTGLRMYLTDLTYSDPEPLFQVLYSTTNLPDSYVPLTTEPLVATDKGSGLYELLFSVTGRYFESEVWFKIVPADPSLTYTFSDALPSPLRAITTAKALLRNWSDFVGSDNSVHVILPGISGMYDSVQLLRVDLPVDFDLLSAHHYAVEVSDYALRVAVDGVYRSLWAGSAQQDSYDLDPAAGRVFQTFATGSLQGSTGLRAFVSDLSFTEFTLDARIAELPALYDTYERQSMILEDGQHFSMPSRGLLQFNALEYAGVRLPDYEFLIAEYVSYALKRIQSAYGMLIDVFGEDGPEMKVRTLAVWAALLSGSLLESIRLGVSALLGLPVNIYEGFVTDAGDGTYIVVDDFRFDFGLDLGAAINPRTGQPYALGDYVPAYQALSGGVRVTDSVVNRGWWYSSQGTGLFNELQKYHSFEVQVDDRLLSTESTPQILSFLDKIRNLGEQYFIVAQAEAAEKWVSDPYLDRNSLLTSDPDLPFLTDSSAPARVDTTPQVIELEPNTMGFGGFGGIDFVLASNLYPGYADVESLLTGGFGDPDEAFASVSLVASGTVGATTAETGLFNDATLSPANGFIFNGVLPGDYLLLKNSAYAYLHIIYEVLSEQQLRISSLFSVFGGSGAVDELGLEYDIIRNGEPVTTDPSRSEIVSGGFELFNGDFLRIQVEGYGSVSLLLGYKPDPAPGQPAQYTPEEVFNRFFYSNGVCRIPGAAASLVSAFVDRRDFGFFVSFPKRIAIQSLEAKGFNSKITVYESPAALALGLLPGEYLGHVTYPGTAHIDSGLEPSPLTSGPYTGSYRLPDGNLYTASPDERADQQDDITRADPGMHIYAEFTVHDGFSIRRDVVGVIGDGEYQLRSEGIDVDSADLGQPYQLVVAGASEFGSFYTDYVMPGEEYSTAIENSVPISGPVVDVPGLEDGFYDRRGVFAGTYVGDFYPLDSLHSSTANFERLLPGDAIGFGETQLGYDLYYVVQQVVSDTAVRFATAAATATDLRTLVFPGVDVVTELGFRRDVLDMVRVYVGAANTLAEVAAVTQGVSGLYDTVTLDRDLPATGSVTVVLGGGYQTVLAMHKTFHVFVRPRLGDLLLVESLSEPTFDRSLWPIYEGDVLRIAQILDLDFDTNAVRLGVEVWRDTAWVAPSYSTACPTTFNGRYIRAPQPFALNNKIDWGRTHRVHKLHNPLADDFTMLQDAISIEVFAPDSLSGVVFNYNGTEVDLPLGHLFTEDTSYSGGVEFTNAAGVPVAEDASIGTGVGEVIAGNKFWAGTDLFAQGMRAGDSFVITGSGAGNDGTYTILGFESLEMTNDVVILDTVSLTGEDGVEYYVLAS